MQNKWNVQIGLLGRAHQTRIVDAENELLMALGSSSSAKETRILFLAAEPMRGERMKPCIDDVPVSVDD